MTRGLDEAEAKKVDNSFRASTHYLLAMGNVLNQKLELMYKDADSTSYSDKDWALYQADNRGYRRAIRDIINLFTK